MHRDTADYLSKVATPPAFVAPRYLTWTTHLSGKIFHRQGGTCYGRALAPSCRVVCLILRLAVLVDHRLVTDRQTDTDTDTGP